MPTFTPTRFLQIGLLGILSTACQQEKPARTEPATSPALADTLNLDSLAQPVATPVRRDWHRVERPTSRNAPLIVYQRGVHKPEAFNADAPPMEARLQDLTLKASEYFQIDPARPAELRGQDGTIVRIPAGALVDRQQRPATGTVWIELKECYSLADLLLSNLLTETETGVALELAGAVLVRATAGGQQLALAAGREMQVEMAEEARRVQQLYYGQAAPATEPVRWAEAPSKEEPEQNVYTTAEQMPGYGNGPADLNRLIRYPRQAQERQTQGLVLASFVVDESGRITSPRIVRSLGDGCDHEVLRVLRQTSGRWKPGRQGGQAVKVRMTLPIRFSFQEGRATAADEMLATTASDPEATLPGFTDVTGGLWVGQLGWVAVGKEWRGPASPYYVPFASATEHTTLRVVVPGRRVVLAGQPQAGGYQFMSVPSFTKVVLLGMRYENGTPFVARQDVRTSSPPDSLQFAETTLGDLEATLARFN
ncbi:energy transducer TonB [Hymenobacter sp. AT01-02]|uniref:energy transducer TonB n=1 Tax=Hymenobacter sp. AT01-02 TaxID=1571877 RepID=UPI000697A7E7|nr:energy transducer TonB [Hymenobacter sp. AT01-02]